MTEIKLIKERQLEIFFSGYYGKPSSKPCCALLPDGDGDYKYSDVNYEDTARTTWEPMTHLNRIKNELLFFGREKIKEDRAWRDKLVGAIRYWLKVNPTSENWWFNQIGALLDLTSIVLALEDYFDEETNTKLETVIRRGSFKTNLMLGESSVFDLPGTKSLSTADKWTGANLIWGGAVTVKHAMWQEDEELLKLASARVAEEIKYSHEGIQPDGAFCQHGHRWYSGGYGRSFAYELTPIIAALAGTRFEIPKEKTDMLVSHMVDGQRLMQRNGIFDFGAVGRDYTRKNPSSMSANGISAPAKLLISAEGVSRKDEISELYRAVHDKDDRITKTTYYDSICLLTHKTPDVYFSVRGRRTGVLGAEHCNQEGVLSYNMSYGTVTCIMESGTEYYMIAPVWDYSKIPGTTAREETDEELLNKGGWSQANDSPCKTSGKAEDSCGILTEYAEHDGISLTASYFTFDSTLVALGTNINGITPNGAKVYTTVDQRFAKEADIEKNLVKCGRVTYKNLADKTEFVSTLEHRIGDWKRNNRFLPETAAEGDVLTVTIPARNGGSYAYLVSVDEVPDVKVLKNDKSCQAILVGENRIFAVFHEDAEITVGTRTVKGKAGELLFE